jgi:hypothetical protein
MFYETDNRPFDLSNTMDGQAAADRDMRHLINRLRLEFRTASQRQLEDAVLAAAQAANTYSSEKLLQLARTHLHDLLTPQPVRDLANERILTPAFRADPATA